MRPTLIALGLCALLLFGIWQSPTPPAEARIQHREFFALGTLMQISLAGPVAPPVIARLQARLKDFEQNWSPQISAGALGTLNQNLQQQAAANLPATLQAGIQRARQACLSSQGLFDPATAPLVELWGFHDEEHYRESPPAASAIDAALKQSQSLCEAEIDSGTIRFSEPGSQLNFGASAKGRAVDIASQLLAEAGIKNAIVNGGGDLKVLGQHPQRPWTIGIRHPRPQDGGPRILGSIQLKDGEALFSSGDYERFFIYEGRRYHHIIDPRSGYPADRAQSATVLHADAEWADAAATALFVAGPEQAEAVMQSMGVALYLLVDAEGGIHMSEAMRQRFQPAS